MSKIKEIHSVLTKNPHTYAYLRLLVSKQIFAISFSLYFLSYLFTIGGFYFWPFSLSNIASIQYHLYSLLVIATAFFGYSLAEYFTAIYFPDKKFLLVIVAVMALIFSGAALSIHLGLLHS